MSIVSDTEILDFVGVDEEYFTVNASNDVLVLSYDGGSATNVELTDGTYDGAGLASQLQTQIDSAFTISSTVTYSSTTRKFTIDVGAGHTIAFTFTGSDAASLFGLDDDHSASQTITSDNPAGDPTTRVTDIRDAVESWLQTSYLGKTIESTSYQEKYDGNGSEYLYLKHYPVTAISRVAIGTRNALKVRNTSTTTNATVSVVAGSSGQVTLTKDGSDTAVTFADYATLSALTTQIAAQTGWEANVHSGYGSFKSTELIECFGRYCLDSTWIDLEIPEKGENDFVVQANQGYIYLPGGFASGSNNIFIDYTAGYSSSNIPEDLKLANKILVQFIWQKREEETFGVRQYTVGGVYAALDSNIPFEAEKILWGYKKIKI